MLPYTCSILEIQALNRWGFFTAKEVLLIWGSFCESGLDAVIAYALRMPSLTEGVRGVTDTEPPCAAYNRNLSLDRGSCKVS